MCLQARKCYHCDRVFQQGWHLDRHLEACHTHHCPKCDRVFNNQTDKEEHLRLAHDKKKSGKKVDFKPYPPLKRAERLI